MGTLLKYVRNCKFYSVGKINISPKKNNVINRRNQNLKNDTKIMQDRLQ